MSTTMNIQGYESAQRCVRCSVATGGTAFCARCQAMLTRCSSDEDQVRNIAYSAADDSISTASTRLNLVAGLHTLRSYVTEGRMGLQEFGKRILRLRQGMIQTIHRHLQEDGRFVDTLKSLGKEALKRELTAEEDEAYATLRAERSNRLQDVARLLDACFARLTKYSTTGDDGFMLEGLELANQGQGLFNGLDELTAEFVEKLPEPVEPAPVLAAA